MDLPRLPSLTLALRVPSPRCLVPHWLYGRRSSPLRTHIELPEKLGGVGVWLGDGEYWDGGLYWYEPHNLLYIGCLLTCSPRAITAFALEKYPDHSTVVSAIINMWRTCGGFSVGYFQPAWIARNGVGVVFGIQAAVVSASIILTIVPLMIMGKRRAERKGLGA